MNEAQMRLFLIERFTEDGSEARESLTRNLDTTDSLWFVGLPIRMIAAAIAENNQRWEERLRKAGVILPDEE